MHDSAHASAWFASCLRVSAWCPCVAVLGPPCFLLARGRRHSAMGPLFLTSSLRIAGTASLLTLAVVSFPTRPISWVSWSRRLPTQKNWTHGLALPRPRQRHARESVRLARGPPTLPPAPGPTPASTPPADAAEAANAAAATRDVATTSGAALKFGTGKETSPPQQGHRPSRRSLGARRSSSGEFPDLGQA